MPRRRMSIRSQTPIGQEVGRHSLRAQSLSSPSTGQMRNLTLLDSFDVSIRRILTRYLKFNHFDLESALKEDNTARVEVENLGLSLEDEDIEYEDEEDIITPCATSLPSVTTLEANVNPSILPTDSTPYASMNPQPRSSKRVKKVAAARRKCAIAAQRRQVNSELKEHAIRVAADATPIELKSFDTSSLPAASNGWTAYSRTRLSPGLQRLWRNLNVLTASDLRLFDWDGESRVILLDASDRVIAILGGIPPGSSGDEWQKAQQHGRRGDFAFRTTGFGYGNGRKQPLNFRINGEENKRAVDDLLKNPAIRRVAGFQQSVFNSYSHKTYVEYQTTNQQLLRRHPHLRANFPGSPYAALTINAGPQSFSPPHQDPDNTVHGWCADTPLAKYNPDLGGHLVLWELRLAIRFPPGSTILFPSALITHSTVPIQGGETRFALIQYSSGRLFRWVANGFQSDKSFMSKASKDAIKERQLSCLRRWKVSLSRFTRWGDLLQGDWKGIRRTEAGLDDLSDLTDCDIESVPTSKHMHL
ncbi:hypothetical protein F5879DRAFT_994920 [Lentinula edodes]|nr:hypothetical protein F5879DRAFT_994920 [Lentinula edodes]